MVEWGEPGITIVMDSLGVVNQLVPASALPYFNAKVIVGHDVSFQVAALQAAGTPFPLGAVGSVVPISFYGKVNQSDTTLVFSKTLLLDPLDIIVPDPTGVDGLIDVFVRAADYAGVAVGITLFLYVDVINNVGNPVNISKWTLTITN